MPGNGLSLLLTAVPDARSAEKLARLLVKRRLAACVSFRDGFISCYTWKGRFEKQREALLLIKTSRKCLPQTRALLERHHPYEVPEILSISISQAAGPYRKWLLGAVGQTARRRRSR